MAKIENDHQRQVSEKLLTGFKQERESILSVLSVSEQRRLNMIESLIEDFKQQLAEYDKSKDGAK